MEIDSSGVSAPRLHGSRNFIADLVISSEPLTESSEPPFDAGTTGMEVLPLGRRRLVPEPEVQLITITGRSRDLHGSVMF